MIMNYKNILLTFFLFSFTAFPQTKSLTSNEIRKQLIEQENVQDQILKLIDSTEVQLQKLDKIFSETDKNSNKHDTEADSLALEFKQSLLAYRSEIAKIKLKELSEFKILFETAHLKAENLKKIEEKIITSPDAINNHDFQQVTEVWRELVDNMIIRLFEDEVFQLELPPNIPESINNFKASKANEIRNLFARSINEKNEVEGQISSFLRLLKINNAKLLLNSGKTRAKLLNILISKHKFSVWSLDPIILNDYAREIQVIPYKFIASIAEKYFEYKSLSQKGINGWSQIVKQLSLLLFVLFLPILIFRSFNIFSEYLENVRKQVFTNSLLDFKKRTKIALTIGRINPYLPWIFAYITLHISNSILASTLLEPITVVIPYMKLYVLYRGFLIIFSTALAKILISKNLVKLKNSQREVQATAFRLSILFFSEITFLHATEDAVRQALIYNLIYDIIFFINLIIIAFETRKWKVELLNLAKLWLNTSIFNFLNTRTSLTLELISLPLLLAGNIVYLLIDWFYQWISQFEFGKKISSEIFKRRLEDANTNKIETQDHTDPEYTRLFLNTDINDVNSRINLSKSPFKKCVSSIEYWLNNQTQEDLILLYGNFGIGKTTILNALMKSFEKHLELKFIDVKEKLIRSDELFKTLSNSLGHEISSLYDIENFDKECSKTIIFIDNIHNLYLNTTYGLEAYKTLIEITSLQLKNIFWCLSCNERALAHLNGVFGKNHFIGTKIELLSWTDSEIQELIMNRHNQSKYKLRFDKVISAVHKGDLLESSSGIEVQFFRLLWGQSRGNPRTAQELWLSATTFSSSKSIRITVPEFTNPKTLADLADETLLIYAAIVKHENLSFEELVETVKLPLNTIRQALKFGEDGIILQKMKNGRWRIHPKGQYVVHAQLIGRNLIYG